MTRGLVTIELCLPSAMISPSLITTTQSLMVRTTSMSCSTNTTVSPSSRRSCTWPMMVWARAGFTPAIGSSSMSSCGLDMSARAISSSLRWPPDSSPANSSRMCVRLNRASSASARSVTSASCCRQPARHSARKKFSPAWPVAPSFMLSSTESRARALVSWNVRTIPRRAMRYDVSPSRVSPSNDHVPELGLSKPVSRLKNVVLPAPLGPMSAVMAPRSTSKWSTSTAVRPPKRRVMPSATRIGSGFGTPGRSSISPKRSSANFVNAGCAVMMPPTAICPGGRSRAGRRRCPGDGRSAAA